MLVENDVVHRLRKVVVDFVQEICGVSGRLSSKCLCVLGHGKNAVDLIIVDLWDLVLRHVLNVVAVLNECVRVDTVLVSPLKALDELLGVLFIEDDKDSRETALLLSNLPLTLESLRLRQILGQSDLPPVT